jgi:hypothetical protein
MTCVKLFMNVTALDVLILACFKYHDYRVLIFLVVIDLGEHVTYYCNSLESLCEGLEEWPYSILA